MNPKVDAYLEEEEKWREETKKLRKIILSRGLTEELKWSKPCYSFENKNVVIIIALKASCALMFCKGALLKDAKGILTKPGENTQAGRWIKFTSVSEVAKLEPTLKAYIDEAIEAEKAGLEVKYKKHSDYKIPTELRTKFGESPTLKKAFLALTPGRQRAYLVYFSAAKQSQTRAARIDKYKRQILEGKGMNDEYLAGRKGKRPPAQH